MRSHADKIRHIAGRISGLPTLPTVVSKMIELVDDPRTHTRTLAKLIANDQSLTARILKLANSAYYGFSREISTVDTAIVVMGFHAVKEMGLSLSVFDTFKNMSNEGNFDVYRYWEHGVGVGVAARSLARKYGTTDAGEMFVAGLLHDIGKMILIQYMADDFRDVEEYMVQRGVSYFDAEAAVLGITHGEIGALIAERWHLPQIITQCIRYHHIPFDAPEAFQKDCAIVNCADLMCHRVSIGLENHRSDTEFEASVLALLGTQASEFTDEFITSVQTDVFVEIDQSDLLSTLNDEIHDGSV